MHLFSHCLLFCLIIMAINFIRVSPTGSVFSTRPLTNDEELK